MKGATSPAVFLPLPSITREKLSSLIIMMIADAVECLVLRQEFYPKADAFLTEIH